MHMFKNPHFALPYFLTLAFSGVVYACAQQHSSNCREDLARRAEEKKQGNSGGCSDIFWKTPQSSGAVYHGDSH